MNSYDVSIQIVLLELVFGPLAFWGSKVGLPGLDMGGIKLNAGPST